VIQKPYWYFYLEIRVKLLEIAHFVKNHKVYSKDMYVVDNFFWLDFCLSQLTSLQIILYHVAGFYKPTIPHISPPSHLQDYSICNYASLEFSTNFVSSFDPNKWCLKNGLHSGDLSS
jgi:hypothetical protein